MDAYPGTRLRAGLALALLAALGAGCDGDGGGSDAGAAADVPADLPLAADTADTADAAAPPDAGPDAPPAGALCPEGWATLTFAVDDSANQTYTDGELIWTGSFSYDAATNVLSYATSWLPDEGPYPVLADDGPWTAGGHEPADAVAGDHVWSIAVCYEAAQDRTFDYGLLNADLRWIWIGPNGRRDIPAGTADVVDFGGQVVEPFGTHDFRVFLDMNALHPDYAGVVTLESHRVFLKGTMNGWAPVQLLDGGALGDEVAGDGIVTYQHGNYLGPHDGLLRTGQEAQFVFVFAAEGIEPDDALEYKDGNGDAAPEGVSAEVACAAGWAPADVALSLDSKGVGKNTAVVACEGEEPPPPECGDDDPCTEPGTLCVLGECVPEVQPECDEVTPCPGEDDLCLNGFCVAPSDGPELLFVVPSSGSSAGGDTVRLQGQGFADGDAVTFDGLAATVQAATATEITVLTPAHAPGPVDVTVTAADGKASTYKGGFTYMQGSVGPSIASVAPPEGPTGGGTIVTLAGAGFEAGATVRFGPATAGAVSVSGDGKTLTCLTPASPVGTVDVVVTNPGGQKATAPGAFTFVPELPDWGQLTGPATLTTVGGKATELLTAQVYEPGVTEGAGPGFGLLAQVGLGPAGTDPRSDAGWTWSDAVYTGEVGNNDAWAGSVTPTEGAWSATFRFSVSAGASWLYVDLTGATDGFDPASLASITATAPGAVVVSALAPATSWPGGGGTVVVSGVGFSETCSVTVGGAAVGATWSAADGTFSFVAPPHPAGALQVKVTCGSDSDQLGLAYVASWDGALGEWPAAAELAETTGASAWGEDNQLTRLLAATDGANLLVGVEGRAVGGEFGANALVAYVDVDLGAGTGIAATSAITDSDGDVDAALGGGLTFDIAGFGADFAFATLDMASITPAELDPASVGAGWRSLADPGDLAWLLDGTVAAGEGGVEALLPLATLLGPKTGATRTLGLVVRVTNADGTFFSNQSLPPGTSGEGDATSTAAASLEVTW